MTYKIEIDYLEHDGGTKFYETVVIKEDGGVGVLIKRYGSMDKKLGGGQVLIERGTHRKVDEGRDAILADKRKMRAGKGQYLTAPLANFGLNSLNQVFNVSPESLSSGITGHYNIKDATAIKSYFGITEEGDVVKEEPAPVVPEEPINRDQSWGSW